LPLLVELIETQACDRAVQERFGFAHLAAVGPSQRMRGLGKAVTPSDDEDVV
jgi:hypothetical protein